MCDGLYTLTIDTPDVTITTREEVRRDDPDRLDPTQALANGLSCALNAIDWPRNIAILATVVTCDGHSHPLEYDGMADTWRAVGKAESHLVRSAQAYLDTLAAHDEARNGEADEPHEQ